jgi:signal transduction histidine kinase
MSIKKSLIVLFTLTVCCIGILSGITIYVANVAQQKIMSRRELVIDISKTYVNRDEDDNSLRMKLGQNSVHWKPLSAQESIGYFSCYVAMIGLPIAYLLFGISIASTLYYRLKLREPILELKKGISNIQKNDLDFSIQYNNQDELGELCASMEKMRSDLRHNYKKLWELSEQRELINASVAHDLRTPITVIKGYLDYLNKNIPREKLTEEMIMETIQYMAEATNRLERYVDSIRDVERIECLEIHIQEVKTIDVIQEIKSNLEQLTSGCRKEIILQSNIHPSTFQIDKQLMFRIVENLVQNAVRYARHKVMVDIFIDNLFLVISVQDDGKGFSATELEKATTLFYSSEKEHSHFGIGLSISKLLCEKQGGNLSIENSPNSGAIVTARIKIS